MKLSRRRTWTIIAAGAALVVAAIVFRDFTLPWEAGWIRQATALTLQDPEEALTGTKLESFLSEFRVDHGRQFDLQCTLRQRTGRVTIRGKDYPVDLIFDKFSGDVLVVHRRWKTLELVRPHH